jgi:hypothetical protein
MPRGHPRCERHPTAAAAWCCESCARNLCEDCAASVVTLAILASITGALVFTRAAEFGHGDPEKYDVPAFPEARPRASRLNQG